MDIIPAFEAVVGGSNPSGSTKKLVSVEACAIFIVVVKSRGHCLMVGRVLAKDEVGVRFSLTAQSLEYSLGKPHKFKDIHSGGYRFGLK